MGENGLAIRSRYLPAEHGGGSRILQGSHQRPQPVRTLRRRIGIQKDAKLDWASRKAWFMTRLGLYSSGRI